ncbi:hypothetical protein HY385_00070 [Candidatus Daviesbacteria bacterium]|nr:hypothetical protein [Candidatus Daviesbacteria bacterium]
MCDRKREILGEQPFPAVCGEDGHFPPAPPKAIEAYTRLKKAWLTTYPKSPGVEPVVSLYPVTEDGITHYVVAKGLIYL